MAASKKDTVSLVGKLEFWYGKLRVKAEQEFEAAVEDAERLVERGLAVKPAPEKQTKSSDKTPEGDKTSEGGDK